MRGEGRGERRRAGVRVLLLASCDLIRLVHLLWRKKKECGRNVEAVLTSLNRHAAAARFHLCERQIGWQVFIHFTHMSTINVTDH